MNKINKILKISLFGILFLVSFNLASAKDLSGRFWLDVENRGAIWYINPDDGIKYEIKLSNAFETFGSIAKPVNDKDLANSKIANSLKGKIVYTNQSKKYIYINLAGKRYELNQNNLLAILKQISTGIKSNDLNASTPIKAGATINLKIDTTKDPYLDKITNIWNLLKQKYAGSVDLEKASQGAIDGMLKSLGDDYTTFFTATSSTSFIEDLNGNFEGIGVEISLKNNIITIVSVLPNTPAESAGLKANDIISAIDGKSTVNMNTEDASKLIRGAAGTEVVLGITRAGTLMNISVIRGSIHFDSVSTSSLENNIAYIKMRTFSLNSPELMNKVADQILASNSKGIILDLRGNPGGYLDTAVRIAGLWIDNNIIVKQKTKDQSEPVDIKSSGVAKLKNVKTVVLVDGGSASASEILAGALQDYGIAKLVGEKTYGKGSVQDFSTLSDGSSIKITIAKWFTPRARTIDKIGIVPDFVISNNLNSDIDLQLNKAIELLR